MSSKQPTIRHKKVVELLVDNGGNNPKSMGEILGAAGYSDAIIHTPSKVTGAAGFQLAMEQAGITDEKLSKVMTEGLDATKYGEADYSVRHKYLETSLRVKGLVRADTEGNTYNTFIQSNTINPNAPKARALADDVLAMLLEKTKAK